MLLKENNRTTSHVCRKMMDHPQPSRALQCGSLERGATLLSAMYRQGMHPAACAVAAVIRACGAAGEWRKGLEILRQAQRVRGSKPDPGSLSAAIEMCYRAGQTVSFSLFWQVEELVRVGCELGNVERDLGRGTHTNPSLVWTVNWCCNRAIKVSHLRTPAGVSVEIYLVSGIPL